MAVAKKGTLVALTTFAAEDAKGVEHIVRTGDTVAANHPAVKGHEQWFAPYDPTKPSAA
jgi:hypothetical protein